MDARGRPSRQRLASRTLTHCAAITKPAGGNPSRSTHPPAHIAYTCHRDSDPEPFLGTRQPIADQLAQGVAICESVDDDNDFGLRHLNPAGAGMTHCDIKAMRGRRLSEPFPGADSFGSLDALRRTGQFLRLKTNLYNDGALELWVENRLSRLSSGLAVFENRFEMVALEQASAESEMRYRRLFENSLVGIFRVSKNRYITDMNRRA
jgi:hypothetical protein